MAAANTDLLKKYKSLFSTTLSTGIGTGTGDTITPATVTGLPTDTAIILTFDRVDSSGVATPSKLERIIGVVSGGNFTSYVRGKDGTTEQAHSSGAVIEMVWNAQDWNDMVDWGLQDHAQLGYHKTLTDTNGNEWIKQTATASAVNEITVANAATGNSPQISATGDDTNIDLKLVGKGTGGIKLGAGTVAITDVLDEDTMSSDSAVKLATQQSIKAYVDTEIAGVSSGSTDGWIDSTAETWTYASAVTFTVSGDQTAKYHVGTKIKLTQTTVKYFYVAAVIYSDPTTTVTVATSTDYTIANAAITANYYSYEENPQGFPDWMAYTPTLTAGTGTLTGENITKSVKFSVKGKTLFVKGEFVLTSVGSGSPGGEFQFTYPTGFTIADDNGVGSGREYAATGNGLNLDHNGGKIIIRTYNNGSIWTNGYEPHFNFITRIS